MEQECPFEEPDVPDNGHFDAMMFQLAVFLGSIQEEISKVLIQNPNVKTETEKILKKPDHEITDALDKAASKFILAMPIASMYGVNLMMNVIEHHSSITGNQTITQACEKVRSKIDSCNFN